MTQAWPAPIGANLNPAACVLERCFAGTGCLLG